MHPERMLRGERVGSAKRNEENVRSIFNLYAQGWKVERLASTFGVSGVLVYRILARKQWAHVEIGCHAVPFAIAAP